MSAMLSIFEWCLSNGQLFIAALLGIIIGIFLSQKFLAPRIHGPAIENLESQIAALTREIHTMGENHKREVDGLSRQVEELKEKLKPFDEMMRERTAELFSARRVG